MKNKIPTVFISYSWDSENHRKWVKKFSSSLRYNGIKTILDQWHLVPGDQLPAFMEAAIRENDFTLVICTPKYKEKADKRIGGVGYEGNVISGELFVQGNQRKFIPILRCGKWEQACPTWAKGKYYIDLSGDPYSAQAYQNLLSTLHSTRSSPPKVGRAQDIQYAFSDRNTDVASMAIADYLEPELLKKRKTCEILNLKFRSPHLISALLSIPSNNIARCLEIAKPGYLQLLKDKLDNYFSKQHQKDSNHNFIAFDLKDHPIIKSAMKLAKDEGESIITEKHIFVAFLHSKSRLASVINEDLGTSGVKALEKALSRQQHTIFVGDTDDKLFKTIS